MSYKTQQKDIVNEVIEKADRPLTPSEILEAGKKELPDLGIATVYRALKRSVNEGRVRMVDLPGTSPHYEHFSHQHHHFFVCQQCHRIFHLLGCVAGLHAMTPPGFEVQRHEIVLYGRCPECLIKS